MKKLLIIVAVIMLMPISVIAEEEPKPYGMQFPEWQQGSLKGLKWGMSRKDCATALEENGLWFDSTTKNSVQRPNMAPGYKRATHTVTIGGRGTFGDVNIASTTVHPMWMFFIGDRLVKIELVSLRVNDDLYKQSRVMFGDGMEQSSNVGHHWRTGKTKNFPFEKEYTCTRFFTYTMIENELKYVWDTKQQKPLRIDVLRLCSWSTMDLYYERGAYERQYFRFQDYLRKRDTARHIRCGKCNGTGKCRDCSGSGFVKGHPQKRCPNHRATYINRLNIPVPCPICRGTGFVIDTSKGTKPCPTCNGTGKCTACKGTGILETKTINKGTKIKYITEEEVNKGSKANEVKKLEANSKLVFE